MKTQYVAAVILVCGSLAGCATTGPDDVETHVTSRKVVAGEKTWVGNAWKLKRDCTADGIPQAYVLEPPKHGKLAFVTEKRFPAMARGPYEKCRDTKVDMLVGYYTSNPGYVGPDEAKFRLSAEDGRITDTVVKVDVLK
ncbi:hypothetical protein [Rhizobium sp. CSW-27]|uniref:hypothetical protein n=1 Tax=Rhizobium sp. CSW-27 TaxID=2839985 RepID=UPI001C018DC4|nr:hypothetical protein [Rhizobium sp. CSW-27]MBT9372017.1 hypothetical protein [Rhizobium sp. CSW-27]